MFYEERCGEKGKNDLFVLKLRLVCKVYVYANRLGWLSSIEDSELVASAVGFVADLELVFLDLMSLRQGFCEELVLTVIVDLTLVEERQ